MSASYKSLPFDVPTYLAGVRRWVECESPSWDGEAVSRMTALAAEELRASGAVTQHIPGRMGFGDCVFADFSPEDKRPGILVLGHLDTVHPIGSLVSRMPWKEEDGRCYGPGLYDMKGGNYLALTAYRELRKAGIALNLPVRFLLTSDEEQGSPSTRELIEHHAAREKYVLVPEGAEPNGRLVTGRYPTRRFQLWVHGKETHAFLQREDGKSAIIAMAKALVNIDGLNGPECSYTPIYLEAGLKIASVPVSAYAEISSTAKEDRLLEEAFQKLHHVIDEPGITAEVRIKAARPTWTPGPQDEEIWQVARGVGEELAIALDHEMLFGGSDGNITGAIGIATLDALGPVGANAHQVTESIDLASIAPRGRLLAYLMATLK